MKKIRCLKVPVIKIASYSIMDDEMKKCVQDEINIATSKLKYNLMRLSMRYEFLLRKLKTMMIRINELEDSDSKNNII